MMEQPTNFNSPETLEAEKPKPLFRSAAVKYKGKIYEGKTHSDAVNKIPNRFALGDAIYDELISREMGYVTQDGTYVKREEAARLIAEQMQREGEDVSVEDISTESNYLNKSGMIEETEQ